MHIWSEYNWERAGVWCRHRPCCTRASLWHQGREDRPSHPGLRRGPLKDLHRGHSQVEVAMEGQVFSWWVHGCPDVPSGSGLYRLLLEKAASSESLWMWWAMADIVSLCHCCVYFQLTPCKLCNMCQRIKMVETWFCSWCWVPGAALSSKIHSECAQERNLKDYQNSSRYKHKKVVDLSQLARNNRGRGETKDHALCTLTTNSGKLYSKAIVQSFNSLQI